MKKVPNLLFLFTDEQAACTSGAYGNPFIQTPALDRLAAGSAVFLNSYVTQPVCTPSRSSILTGLYPHANGCGDNNAHLDEQRFPALPLLSDFSDYATAYMGKWHLGDEVFRQHGFQTWVSMEDGYKKHYSEGRDKTVQSDYFHFLKQLGYTPDGEKCGIPVFTRDFCTHLPERHSKPAFLAERACAFLETHTGDPFLLYVSFLEPHMPFFSCRDAQYRPEDMPVPQSFLTPPAENCHLKNRYAAQKAMLENYRSASDWRALIARYYGLVSLVDNAVGCILSKLEQLHLEQDTIVVFTSDHGDMMSAHGMFGKSYMYEECCKVPLMIRIPGRSLARKVPEPVCSIDLVPTLLDALGKHTNRPLHGKSLLNTVCRGDKPDRDVFYEWNVQTKRRLSKSPDAGQLYANLGSPETIATAFGDSIRTVVTQDGWKLAFSVAGMHELYDLNADPSELHNLAFQPQYAERMRALAAKIAHWQAETADPLPRVSF